MKPRNREINIFNMSLLDVLCGALGAFCFMMLVLFPSYRQNPQSNPPAPPPGPPPQNCEECMQKHEGMQKRMEEMNARNTQLEMRNPFTVEMIPRSAGYDVDLYIEDDRRGGGGVKAAPPDVKVSQDRKFDGDRYVGGTGAYPEIWMVRDAPKGAYRVYYKVMKFSAQPTTIPILVEGRIVTEGGAAMFPPVVVRKVGEILHVATITSDGQGGFNLKPEMPPADPEKVNAEREEWFRSEQLKQDEERRKQEQQKKQAPEPKQEEQKKQ